MYTKYNYDLADPPLEVPGLVIGASSVSGSSRWDVDLLGDIRVTFGDLLGLARLDSAPVVARRQTLKPFPICWRPK